MDVFVLPSRTTPRWKEQFGRVLIEALASGVPVVGSDSGQIPHLIRETGGGLVFPEGDEAALALALDALIGNPAERARLAAAGGRAVRERFTCEAVARRLHALLSGIVRPGTFSLLSAAEKA
jgi:glycosyltransferase involved in cell wall biosynthesis